MLSLFPICCVPSKFEAGCRSCIRRVTVQPGAGLPSVSSALGDVSLAPRHLILCICKQHYRWKRFRRCLANINPICVLTHFKCACRCTHEMRETLRRSNGCNTNISKDFSGHTKGMSSLRGSAFNRKKRSWWL